MPERKSDVVREGWSARELAEQTPYKDLGEMRRRLVQGDARDDATDGRAAANAITGEEAAADEGDSRG